MSQQITANLSALNAAVVIQTDVSTLPTPGTVGVQIGQNWTGTLVFEATIDQINWFSVNGTPITSVGGLPVPSTTAGGQWAISVFGFAQVRVRFSQYSAGTAVVSLDTGGSAVPTTPLVGVSTQGDTQGGPPLASGLPSTQAFTDIDKSFQGSDSAQIIVTAIAGQTFITVQDNPWIQGLTLGSRILLSAAPNTQAIEEVIVGQNNIPSAGTGTFVVNLVNPVVNNGSNFATFDVFGVDGPTTIGINRATPGLTVPGQTVVGVKGQLQYLYNPQSTDPKRPIVPWTQAPYAPGVGAVINVPDPAGANDLVNIRRYMESILYELRIMNYFMMQLKDGGPMEMPQDYHTLQDSQN